VSPTWIAIAVPLAAIALTVLALQLRARALRRLELPFEPDELHWAKTEDGWELPMGRYLPRGERAAREPVLLCHGMGANRFNLDLNERYSLARYLAARGFDTFVVELRGCGITRRPPNASQYRHNFDDEVRFDIPALIARAREVSGSPRVLWAGHSKGGMVMYGYCGSAPRTEVAGAVAIGSPLKIAPAIHPLILGTASRLESLPLLDAVYIAPATRTLAPIGRTGILRLRYMAASENMEPEVTGFAMANLIGNVSRRTLRQFSKWRRTGTFASWDGTIDYKAGLAASPVPFLLIAGAGDILVPPLSVEAARDAMTAARVDYVVASKAGGFSADYGHGDLVLGRKAPDEIFPVVEAWLRKTGSRG
jgi:pimeloyl-ACP methyl ester carboxylesterase